ncbi:MAG TPA: DUF2071 domain-containing protein [Fimbriimonas sp.]
MLESEHYLALRARPSGSPVMHMKWRDLAFLHFSTDVEVVQALLPEGLTVDTFDDRAWVGVIPFFMKDTRPVGLPPIPGTADFPEFNCRTYVHRDGVEPGVWFFNLDAANWLAVQAARATFGLPYYHSEMSVETDGTSVSYYSKRKEGHVDARLVGQIVHGEEIHHAEPGSLEFFLIERYLLYSLHFGKLMTARVSHAPYPLQPCEVIQMETNFTDVVGIPSRPWEHVAFSGGVDVDVYAPRS